MNLAVDDVGVGARGGAVEGPLKFAEGERQSAEGDVAVGAWIAQAFGFAGEMRSHFGEQLRLIEVEVFAELELEGAADGFAARKPEIEDCGRVTARVSSLGDGDKDEAGFFRGGLDGGDERGFEIGGHKLEILVGMSAGPFYGRVGR